MRKGQKMSEAQKKKISLSERGKRISKETLKKLSLSHTGHKHSPETRLKMSEAKRGAKAYQWKGGLDNNYWSRIRRNRRNATLGTHTAVQWEALKKKFLMMCACCKKKEPIIKLTEDHIIPICKGGTDFIENIQPLCKPCNSRKHTKTIRYEI